MGFQMMMEHWWCDVIDVNLSEHLKWNGVVSFRPSIQVAWQAMHRISIPVSTLVMAADSDTEASAGRDSDLK